MMNINKQSVERATSAPPVNRNALTTPKLTSATTSKSNKSGAAYEEMFTSAFEDVQRVQIFSSKDLDQEITKIKDTCSDPSLGWEKRVESLKRFRSLLVAGAADFDEFNSYLKPLELPFQVSVKDLRSQVVREACITVAYLSQRLGIKCDRFAEALLPTLINLIQNSAKIMSSSAVVAIRFIIQHTHASRLIPVITYNICSKSKEIRKSCYQFLDQLLHTWPKHSLEKHVGILQEAIKKGISDADAEARAYARKAFWAFAYKFKHEADYLLNSLDSSKQRMLYGEQNNISNWNSTNSLDQPVYKQRPQSLRTNSVSSSGSVENVNKQTSGLVPKYRAETPVFSPRWPTFSPRCELESGAIDEDIFMNSFEDVQRVQIFSVKDLDHEITKIKETCSDPSINWEKRVESLRRFRSLLIAGAADFDEFNSYLKPLELPFHVSIKDLRSSVVREACITVAYLSERIGIRCDRFAEALLPTLINLIQNRARIMSSSAVVAIRFIIQHTHASRLLPVITYNISSKSKEIRKSCCEFLCQLLHTWPDYTLDKHAILLQEAIKKGISDADAEVRAYSRKAFWGFAEKFKHEAEYLLNSLDSSKQRILYGEQNNISYWNSTNSLNRAVYNQRPQSLRTNSVSSCGSVENINKQTNGFSPKNRSGIPLFSPRNGSANARVVIPSPFRTTSAIDPGAQRRAKARAAFVASFSPPKVVSSGYSLPRTTTPKKYESSVLTSPERSRTKARVSKSQPGSRSASPSSRFDYYTTMQSESRSHRVRRKSGIPISISRETSPTRSSISSIASIERRLSSGSRNRHYVTSNSSERQTPSMTEKILQQSLEAEAALEDALSLGTEPLSPPKTFPNNSSRSQIQVIQDYDEADLSASSEVWPQEECMEILKSICKTEESSVNIAAIKRLSKFIEFQPKDIVMELLSEMMPILVQAYDNPECAVRKAAVFCMVSIHGVVGESMNPYLSALNGSKMKLLKIYIERAKSQSNGRNSHNTNSSNSSNC